MANTFELKQMTSNLPSSSLAPSPYLTGEDNSGDYILSAFAKGALTGFSGIPLPVDLQTTSQKIAYSVGNLLGFAPGMIGAPMSLAGKALIRFGAKEAAEAAASRLGASWTASIGRRLVDLAPAVANLESVPLWGARRVWQSEKGKALLTAGHDLVKGSAMPGVAKKFAHKTISGGSNLGMAMGIASWYDTLTGHPEQFIKSFAHGFMFGGAFGAIGELAPSMGLTGAAQTAFKAVAGSVTQGLPSTFAGEDVGVQLYEYLLGSYFGVMEKPWAVEQAMHRMHDLTKDIPGAKTPEDWVNSKTLKLKDKKGYEGLDEDAVVELDRMIKGQFLQDDAGEVMRDPNGRAISHAEFTRLHMLKTLTEMGTQMTGGVHIRTLFGLDGQKYSTIQHLVDEPTLNSLLKQRGMTQVAGLSTDNQVVLKQLVKTLEESKGLSITYDTDLMASLFDQVENKRGIASLISNDRVSEWLQSGRLYQQFEQGTGVRYNRESPTLWRYRQSANEGDRGKLWPMEAAIELANHEASHAIFKDEYDAIIFSRILTRIEVGDPLEGFADRSHRKLRGTIEKVLTEDFSGDRLLNHWRAKAVPEQNKFMEALSMNHDSVIRSKTDLHYRAKLDLEVGPKQQKFYHAQTLKQIEAKIEALRKDANKGVGQSQNELIRTLLNEIANYGRGDDVMISKLLDKALIYVSDSLPTERWNEVARHIGRLVKVRSPLDLYRQKFRNAYTITSDLGYGELVYDFEHSIKREIDQALKGVYKRTKTKPAKVKKHDRPLEKAGKAEIEEVKPKDVVKDDPLSKTQYTENPAFTEEVAKEFERVKIKTDRPINEVLSEALSAYEDYGKPYGYSQPAFFYEHIEPKLIESGASERQRQEIESHFIPVHDHGTRYGKATLASIEKSNIGKTNKESLVRLAERVYRIVADDVAETGKPISFNHFKTAYKAALKTDNIELPESLATQRGLYDIYMTQHSRANKQSNFLELITESFNDPERGREIGRIDFATWGDDRAPGERTDGAFNRQMHENYHPSGSVLTVRRLINTEDGVPNMNMDMSDPMYMRQFNDLRDRALEDGRVVVGTSEANDTLILLDLNHFAPELLPFLTADNGYPDWVGMRDTALHLLAGGSKVEFNGDQISLDIIRMIKNRFQADLDVAMREWDFDREDMSEPPRPFNEEEALARINKKGFGTSNFQFKRVSDRFEIVYTGGTQDVVLRESDPQQLLEFADLDYSPAVKENAKQLAEVLAYMRYITPIVGPHDASQRFLDVAHAGKRSRGEMVDGLVGTREMLTGVQLESINPRTKETTTQRHGGWGVETRDEMHVNFAKAGHDRMDIIYTGVIKFTEEGRKAMFGDGVSDREDAAAYGSSYLMHALTDPVTGVGDRQGNSIKFFESQPGLMGKTNTVGAIPSASKRGVALTQYQAASRRHNEIINELNDSISRVNKLEGQIKERLDNGAEETSAVIQRMREDLRRETASMNLLYESEMGAFDRKLRLESEIEQETHEASVDSLEAVMMRLGLDHIIDARGGEKTGDPLRNDRVMYLHFDVDQGEYLIGMPGENGIQFRRFQELNDADIEALGKKAYNVRPEDLRIQVGAHDDTGYGERGMSQYVSYMSEGLSNLWSEAVAAGQGKKVAEAWQSFMAHPRQLVEMLTRKFGDTPREGQEAADIDLGEEQAIRDSQIARMIKQDVLNSVTLGATANRKFIEQLIMNTFLKDGIFALPLNRRMSYIRPLGSDEIQQLARYEYQESFGGRTMSDRAQGLSADIDWHSPDVKAWVAMRSKKIMEDFSGFPYGAPGTIDGEVNPALFDPIILPVSMMNRLVSTRGKTYIESVGNTEDSYVSLARAPILNPGQIRPGKIYGFLPEIGETFVISPKAVKDQGGGDHDGDKVAISSAQPGEALELGKNLDKFNEEVVYLGKPSNESHPAHISKLQVSRTEFDQDEKRWKLVYDDVLIDGGVNTLSPNNFGMLGHAGQSIKTINPLQLMGMRAVGMKHSIGRTATSNERAFLLDTLLSNEQNASLRHTELGSPDGPRIYFKAVKKKGLVFADKSYVDQDHAGGWKELVGSFNVDPHDKELAYELQAYSSMALGSAVDPFKAFLPKSLNGLSTFLSARQLGVRPAENYNEKTQVALSDELAINLIRKGFRTAGGTYAHLPIGKLYHFANRLVRLARGYEHNPQLGRTVNYDLRDYNAKLKGLKELQGDLEASGIWTGKDGGSLRSLQVDNAPLNRHLREAKKERKYWKSWNDQYEYEKDWSHSAFPIQRYEPSAEQPFLMTNEFDASHKHQVRYGVSNDNIMLHSLYYAMTGEWPTTNSDGYLMDHGGKQIVTRGLHDSSLFLMDNRIFRLISPQALSDFTGRFYTDVERRLLSTMAEQPLSVRNEALSMGLEALLTPLDAELPYRPEESKVMRAYHDLLVSARNNLKDHIAKGRQDLDPENFFTQLEGLIPYFPKDGPTRLAALYEPENEWLLNLLKIGYLNPESGEIMRYTEVFSDKRYESLLKTIKNNFANRNKYEDGIEAYKRLSAENDAPFYDVTERQLLKDMPTDDVTERKVSLRPIDQMHGFSKAFIQGRQSPNGADGQIQALAFNIMLKSPLSKERKLFLMERWQELSRGYLDAADEAREIKLRIRHRQETIQREGENPVKHMLREFKQNNRIHESLHGYETALKSFMREEGRNPDDADFIMSLMRLPIHTEKQKRQYMDELYNLHKHNQEPVFNEGELRAHRINAGLFLKGNSHLAFGRHLDDVPLESPAWNLINKRLKEIDQFISPGEPEAVRMKTIKRDDVKVDPDADEAYLPFSDDDALPEMPEDFEARFGDSRDPEPPPMDEGHDIYPFAGKFKARRGDEKIFLQALSPRFRAKMIIKNRGLDAKWVFSLPVNDEIRMLLSTLKARPDIAANFHQIVPYVLSSQSGKPKLTIDNEDEVAVLNRFLSRFHKSPYFPSPFERSNSFTTNGDMADRMTSFDVMFEPEFISEVGNVLAPKSTFHRMIELVTELKDRQNASTQANPLQLAERFGMLEGKENPVVKEIMDDPANRQRLDSIVYDLIAGGWNVRQNDYNITPERNSVDTKHLKDAGKAGLKRLELANGAAEAMKDLEPNERMYVRHMHDRVRQEVRNILLHDQQSLIESNAISRRIINEAKRLGVRGPRDFVSHTSSRVNGKSLQITEAMNDPKYFDTYMLNLAELYKRKSYAGDIKKYHRKYMELLTELIGEKSLDQLLKADGATLVGKEIMKVVRLKNGVKIPLLSYITRKVPVRFGSVYHEMIRWMEKDLNVIMEAVILPEPGYMPRFQLQDPRQALRQERQAWAALHEKRKDVASKVMMEHIDRQLRHMSEIDVSTRLGQINPFGSNFLRFMPHLRSRVSDVGEPQKDLFEIFRRRIQASSDMQDNIRMAGRLFEQYWDFLGRSSMKKAVNDLSEKKIKELSAKYTKEDALWAAGVSKSRSARTLSQENRKKYNEIMQLSRLRKKKASFKIDEIWTQLKDSGSDDYAYLRSWDSILKSFIHDGVGFVSAKNMVMKPQSILPYAIRKIVFKMGGTEDDPAKNWEEYMFDISDEAVRENWNNFIDKLSGEKGSVFKRFKIEDRRTLASFAHLEGYAQLLSKLAHPRAGVTNLYGGLSNAFVKSSLREVINGWKYASNPEFIEMSDRAGVIPDLLMSETDAFVERIERRKPVSSDFVKELRGLATRNGGIRKLAMSNRAELSALLHKYNLPQSIASFAGQFMSATELKLRRTALAIGYKKGLNMGLEQGSALKFAKSFVTTTQFIYHNANRNEFARTSLGKISTRFRHYIYNAIKMHRDIVSAARLHGATDAKTMQEFQNMITAIMFMSSLAALLPWTLFEYAMPPHIDWLQDSSALLFGDEDERKKAFFGTYGIGAIGSPAEMLIVKTLLAVGSDDVGAEIWKNVVRPELPFQRIGRSVLKTAPGVGDPTQVVDEWLGIPLKRIADATGSEQF